MSEEEFEEYYKKIEPNFNSKIEKGTIEMSNEYYNAIEERMARLINKNNNLQSQLQHKEKNIKEAINCIKEESWFCYKDNEEIIDRTPVNKLLEILGDNDENI